MYAKYAQLIFDLDGTLSDPKEGVFKCFNYALEENGFSAIAEAQIDDYIGPPLDVSFIQTVGSDDPKIIASLVAAYRERYASQGYAENRLYEGIPEMLEALRIKGISMGVCTLKRKDFAEIILEMFHIADYFSFIDGGNVGGSKSLQLKRLAADGTVSSKDLMIGDRAGDLDAARQNGLSSAGVLWGYGSEEELKGEEPAHLFGKPGDIVELCSLGGV